VQQRRYQLDFRLSDDKTLRQSCSVQQLLGKVVRLKGHRGNCFKIGEYLPILQQFQCTPRYGAMFQALHFRMAALICMCDTKLESVNDTTLLHSCSNQQLPVQIC